MPVVAGPTYVFAITLPCRCDIVFAFTLSTWVEKLILMTCLMQDKLRNCWACRIETQSRFTSVDTKTCRDRLLFATLAERACGYEARLWRGQSRLAARSLESKPHSRRSRRRGAVALSWQPSDRRMHDLW